MIEHHLVTQRPELRDLVIKYVLYAVYSMCSV